ncbi:ATP-binding protein [Micromonospora peucetia]|uniref:histidine kinase n=1 Tax=Micromonospora peucetia TaxID=47871 RepID=A0ABZ1EDQ2_9ACTN|nr:ATP-binding protein [Micromonospora peucetia]MCX4390803.1 ATP-binding protein [Micromonospora peucetia]WSA31743.1 ATP-binding protein [Micromonospora peucetia]
MTRPTGDLFADGGETGRLMAGLDWSATPLGPVDGWPQSLRAAVRMVLSSRYPMLLLWGDRFTQLYNDAYSALIGAKHPGALGGDVRVTLAEGWDVLAPLIDEAMATGVASWVPALRLLLDRAGYREEAYFSVSHAPARDDEGRTVGVLTVCSEVTDQVVGERRLRLLRDLSIGGDGRTVDVESTCARLAEAVGGYPLDVPFAAIYLREGALLRRAACVGGEPVAAALPATLPTGQNHGWGPELEWGLAATATGTTIELAGFDQRLALPAGPWGDPVRTALALPLPSVEADQQLGMVLVGVSPSRRLDEAYRSFYALLAQQVAVAVRNARAYEQERRRAEALAELDRVKTGFFTNVSHEFRTPLTLMLGPLTDALNDNEHPLPATQRERVDTAWRNATRLLTLVNSLLTFSSLEAGQARSEAREVDLAGLTTELASVFRAAVERAGLRLEVDCPPLPRAVSVDPVNWERIVTNLLSNALKYTFVGRIRVALTADDEEVRLTVADTGIGIAETDLTRLFERFHRVQGARSRSHEGTGIGLALVRELARLEGGDVRVESQVGAGTTFTVAMPWSTTGWTAGPVADVGGVGDAARAAVQETTGWLTDPAQAGASAPAGPPVPAYGPVDALRGVRILVADDNADMRAYLARLLGGQGWRVETVGDGRQALAAIRREQPDLVLTDVMMPDVDGFELVRRLRGQADTRALPVVVLSARAGGDASVEGLDLGADDYVVKPFTAAELIARIRAILHGVRTRGHRRADAMPGPGGSFEPAAGSAAGAGDGASGTGDASDDSPPLGGGPASVPDSGPSVGGSEGRAHNGGRWPAPDHLTALDTGWTYPSQPTSAAAMRRDVRASLEGLDVDPDTVADLLLAASEAVNNAVEHAQRPTRPEVRVRLRVADDTVRISVRDFGTWRDRRPAMDRGRGATLMNAYGDVRMVSTAEGTTVTIERRLPPTP